ncbi:hypothetical protein J3F83DRAFT_412537 [Trichoderma novae-zelandiae]
MSIEMCNCEWMSGHGITNGSQNHDAMHTRHHHSSSNPLGVTLAPRVRPLKPCITGQADKGPRGAAPCINSISSKCLRDVSADTVAGRIISLRYGHQCGHQSSTAGCGNYTAAWKAALSFEREDLKSRKERCRPHLRPHPWSPHVEVPIARGPSGHKRPRRGRIEDQTQTAGLVARRRSRGTCPTNKQRHCTATFLRYHAGRRLVVGSKQIVRFAGRHPREKQKSGLSRANAISIPILVCCTAETSQHNGTERGKSQRS